MIEQAIGLEFPCEFPIKVFMRDDANFAQRARQIVERHAGELADGRVTVRASRNAKFVAVTYTIDAQSRAQLDAIYKDLTSCEETLMAL